MSHHERYECDEKKDHSSDILYAQDYSPEKHIQQIGREFGTFTRSKQNIARTSKNSKMDIVRRGAKKYLTRTFIRQFGRGLPIYEIYRSRDNFTPKMRRNKR